MLILSRKRHEEVVLDLRNIDLSKLAEPIVRIGVSELRGDKVRLSCDVDKAIPCHRNEVFDAIERERSQKPAA